MDKKLELKLHEDNELSFKLSIEGTVSDPELAAPRFRFTVTELGEETGWIFPARKEADDIVSVTISAPMKAGFKANKVYKGTLEVILGRLYFSPAEVQLEFATPLEIQAEITTASNSKSILEKVATKTPSSKPTLSAEDYDEDEISSVIADERKAPRAPAGPVRQQRTMVSEKRLQALKGQARGTTDPSRQPSARPHPQVTKKPIEQAPSEAAQKEQFKARLLNMFKSALSE